MLCSNSGLIPQIFSLVIAGSNPAHSTCGMEQRLACQSHKLEVGGSNPTSATKRILTAKLKGKTKNLKFFNKVQILKVFCKRKYKSITGTGSVLKTVHRRNLVWGFESLCFRKKWKVAQVGEGDSLLNC